MQAINDSTQAQYKKLVDVYELNLRQSQLTLTGTQNSLAKVQDNLKEMKETILEVRKENFMKKFWVGAGCTGAGIIIGLLLTR